MSKQIKADLSLLGVTIGWGFSFILTKNLLASLSAYNFIAIRFLIAFAISSLVFLKNMKNINRDTLKYGFLIGFILFVSFVTQTIGLLYTSVSKSAFITGFSVVLVPLISALYLKKMPEKPAAIGAIFAIIGLALLTLNDNLIFNIGDFYTIICAFGYAMHIIIVGKYTGKVDSIALGVIQIGVVGILSLIMTLIVETPIFPTGIDVWTNILILSIVCTCGAYIVQSTAQKFTTPTHTALIYSGEPVFAAIFAYIFVGELLSPKGIIGAFLILLGMIIAEVDFKSIIQKRKLKKCN